MFWASSVMSVTMELSSDSSCSLLFKLEFTVCKGTSHVQCTVRDSHEHPPPRLHQSNNIEVFHFLFPALQVACSGSNTLRERHLLTAVCRIPSRNRRWPASEYCTAAYSFAACSMTTVLQTAVYTWNSSFVKGVVILHCTE
jgi:hypothetical protein